MGFEDSVWGSFNPNITSFFSWYVLVKNSSLAYMPNKVCQIDPSSFGGSVRVN